ncbi:MAG: phosphotransferase [Ardenticatenales bacterium]|nr:phosphotransferase [Ardenticatenales bacterium]
MTQMEQLPDSAETITAAWLTDVLRSTGTIQSATVSQIRLEPIGDVAGFMGEITRVFLYYDLPEETAPRTLIAKFPTTDRRLRAALAVNRLYEREVRFYQDVASQIKMRIPHCYFSTIDDSGQNPLLLLEDLAPAQVGDQIAGCTAAEAQLAIVGVAKLHAAFWNSPDLKKFDWARVISSPDRMDQKAYQQYKWPRFFEKLGPYLSDLILDVTREYGELMPEIARRMGDQPQTMIHGDYRLDNLFFNQSGEGVPFAAIDWQTMKLGSGTCDVAYFLSDNLKVELRRAEELNLLHQYHRTLLEQGVPDYSFAQCLADYRLSFFFRVHILVEGGFLFDFSDRRQAELMEVRLRRLSAILEDQDILGLLASIRNNSSAL